MSNRPSAPRGAASFEALPDDVAMAIFKELPRTERCGPAALVCRRFHALATHPSLLRNVILHVYEAGRSGAAADGRLAAKLNSLCAFLVRHAAPHLRRFELRVELPSNAMPATATCAALKTLTCRLAAHCSAYGALEELSMEGHNVIEPLAASCFTPLAPSLRRLRHEMGDEVDYYVADWVEPNLAALTGLRELWIAGREQQLDDGTVFPPALTRLHLGCFEMFGLPPSLSSLKQLQYLSLAHCAIDGDDLAPVAHCAALTQLTLEHCSHIPPSLAQLAQLRVLRIEDSPHDEEEQPAGLQALLGALCQLTRLTHLALRGMEWLEGVPAEVGSLPQLACFCWQSTSWVAPDDLQLPGGPWLASLRQLALPLGMAATNLQRLTAATQLECLAMQPYHLPWHCEPTAEQQRQRQLNQAAVLAWAAQHPTLSRLAMDDEQPGAVYGWRAALARARWPGRPPLAMLPSQPIFEELGCTSAI